MTNLIIRNHNTQGQGHEAIKSRDNKNRANNPYWKAL